MLETQRATPLQINHRTWLCNSCQSAGGWQRPPSSLRGSVHARRHQGGDAPPPPEPETSSAGGGADTHGLGAAGKPPAPANLPGATAQESSPNKAAGQREWWAKKLDCRRL